MNENRFAKFVQKNKKGYQESLKTYLLIFNQKLIFLLTIMASTTLVYVFASMSYKPNYKISYEFFQYDNKFEVLDYLKDQFDEYIITHSIDDASQKEKFRTYLQEYEEIYMKNSKLDSNLKQGRVTFPSLLFFTKQNLNIDPLIKEYLIKDPEADAQLIMDVKRGIKFKIEHQNESYFDYFLIETKTNNTTDFISFFSKVHQSFNIQYNKNQIEKFENLKREKIISYLMSKETLLIKLREVDKLLNNPNLNDVKSEFNSLIITLGPTELLLEIEDTKIALITISDNLNEKIIALENKIKFFNDFHNYVLNESANNDFLRDVNLAGLKTNLRVHLLNKPHNKIRLAILGVVIGLLLGFMIATLKLARYYYKKY